MSHDIRAFREDPVSREDRVFCAINSRRPSLPRAFEPNSNACTWPKTHNARRSLRCSFVGDVLVKPSCGTVQLLVRKNRSAQTRGSAPYIEQNAHVQESHPPVHSPRTWNTRSLYTFDEERGKRATDASRGSQGCALNYPRGNSQLMYFFTFLCVYRFEPSYL